MYLRSKKEGKAYFCKVEFFRNYISQEEITQKVK